METTVSQPTVTLPEEVRGALIEGHSDGEINSTFAEIENATGVNMVCVWDFCDQFGFAGHSQYYRLDPDGRLFEIAAPLWDWLTTDPGTSVTLPGDPGEWFAREPEPYTAGELDGHDGARNYAFRDDN